MAEVGEKPADAVDHVPTLETESGPEDGNAEKAPEHMDAEVPDKIFCLQQDLQRPKEEILETAGEAHKHLETSSKESDKKFNFVMEDLKQELRRLEEENQLLSGSSNESRYPVYNALQESPGDEVEGIKLDLKNQGNDDQGLKLVAELETLKAQLQIVRDSHARLASETLDLRQEKEVEVSRLSGQIFNLERQLLSRSNDLESNLESIDDEKIKLKNQMVSILEGRQKREDELVGMLRTCQQQVRSMEVEQQNLTSTIETSNAAVRQLEGHNAALSSEFEQQKQFAERKIADLASELQAAQDQRHELQLQLQGLREENTHVVMKASKLGQDVEELKSEKMRLSNDLERLVHERARRDEELEVELRTSREHLQILEAEKSKSVTLVGNLITQVRELEEDKRHLTGLSNEASQSMQHLWEENTRLIEGYNRLEHEKQVNEGERMELVAGIQTVWEQLHAANEREALLGSDLRGLNERRDAEEVLFDQKLQDLHLKLEASEQEKSDLISKSEETTQVLKELRQETSQKLKDLREEKDQLAHEVSELVKLKVETEHAASVQQISWETQFQGLESEKAAAMAMVADLEQQLQVSKEEVKGLKEVDEKSSQLILELREEVTRLSGEIDKLEEVKERQEGERLELAADLQAAWDQIQAVRDSEASLATELSELKDLRNEEKLKSDELIQELRRELHELEERTSEAGTKVEQLSKRLNELRREQELQDENERLAADIAMLDQQTSSILAEKAVLQREAQSLQDRVESLELDKSKMASEIEELNQWLQGPAAEKKQLAANLDEINRLVKGLELERTQLTISVSELQEEKVRLQNEAEKLQNTIHLLEKEKENSLTVHEDMIRQLESLEEERQRSLKIQEDSALLVQNLNEKIRGLEEESIVMISVREDSLRRLEESLLWAENLEVERAEIVDSLNSSNLLVEKLKRENLEYIRKAVTLKEEVESKHAMLQELGVKIEGLSTVYQSSLLQLQALEDEKADLRKSLDASNVSVQVVQGKSVEHLERVKFLEEEVSQKQVEALRLEKETERISSLHQDSLLQLELFKREKTDLLNSLNASNSSVQQLQVKNEQHTITIKTLEDEVAEWQVKVGRLENHTETLSTENQNALLQLHTFAEEKDLPAKALDVLKLSVQKLQEENHEHVRSASFVEEEIKRRQAHIQDTEEKMESLSAKHQDTLLQLRTLEEEKVEMVKCLDAYSTSFLELQRKNVEHSERVTFLEDEVARKRAELQRFEALAESLLATHEDSLIQLQGLEVEKSAITNQLHECQDLIRKLHTENSELASAARKLQELYQRREKIESLDSPVHSLDDKDFREASEIHGVPLQLQSLEGAVDVARCAEGCGNEVQQGSNEEVSRKLKCSKLLEQSELVAKKLEMENMELSRTVSRLEKQLHDGSEIFRDQIQSLKVERESFGQECFAKLHCSEVEKSLLVRALEESNLTVADLQSVVTHLKTSVLDLEHGKDELANQISLLEEQNCVISAGRDQLSVELQGVREQLQVGVERLQEAENVAKRSKVEALELSKQLENFREQAENLHKYTTQSRRLEMPNQVGHVVMRHCDHVTELEPVLDRDGTSFGLSRLIGSNIDPREELQQASLGWVEIITTVCQELAKLLRSVGEEKDKLARKQGMSRQKTEVLTNLCQELDKLILGVREKTENFAEELSILKHKLAKSKNERYSLGSDGDLNICDCQQPPRVVTSEVGESILDVETSCRTLQSTQAGRTELEAHVANLSSCLADSQSQLKALVIKNSAGNPYLLTSRADDGGHRKGLACFSADDNGVLNYGSELKVGRNIKALDQEKKEKKGNAALTSFAQRTQTPGRSFKKCKVTVQQPKRRWIF